MIAFYVADWHPVYTAQLQCLRDMYPEIQRTLGDVVAISADTVRSHAAFGGTNQLPFPLLTDDRPRGATARSYGVYDPRREASTQRALFVVSDSGVITWSGVFPDALDPGVDPILTALESLRSAAASPETLQGVDA